MIDLTSQFGLSITLDEATGDLGFGTEIEVASRGVRLIGDLTSVLAEPAEASDREDEIAYRIYRGISTRADAPALNDAGLRFDLIVTLPGAIGGEFFKTAGHEHTLAPDGVGYPEIYEVVSGSAAFVLQFHDPFEVVIALCESGDRILIPPGATHLTINRGETALVVSNLIAQESGNLYEHVIAHQGAAVYLLRGQSDGAGFRQHLNANYPSRPIWRTIDGSRVGMFGGDGHNLYDDAIRFTASYRFLTAPASSASEMQALWIASSSRPEQ